MYHNSLPQNFQSPNLPNNGIFFMYCETLESPKWHFLILMWRRNFGRSWYPKITPKRHFFELNFENLPKTTYFLIRSKSLQNDNYFFGQFFQKNKNNIAAQPLNHHTKMFKIKFLKIFNFSRKVVAVFSCGLKWEKAQFQLWKIVYFVHRLIGRNLKKLCMKVD